MFDEPLTRDMVELISLGNPDYSCQYYIIDLIL